jgi:hypothetical protein
MRTETGTGDFHAFRADDGRMFERVDWDCVANGVDDVARGIKAAHRHETIVVVVQQHHPELKWTAYLLEGATEFDEPLPHGATASVWYLAEAVRTLVY